MWHTYNSVSKCIDFGSWPWGGYNTLAFFHWESQHVDLVEANPWGRKDMEKLFAQQRISSDRYDVYPCKIEDYKTDKKYDFIIAEGFLQNLYNQREVINKLQSLAAKNGVIVVTCTDAVCYFIELMKRLVGCVLSADITEYDEKVEYLADLFAPQLAALKGVSRNPKEWVQDQILDTPNVNGMELSLLQAIDYFAEEFDVLGCSPRMFTDYSWYKDIWYNNREDYEKQFLQKRLSLLMANMPEMLLPMEQVNTLVEHFDNIKKMEIEYENTSDIGKIDAIIEEMDSMQEILKQRMDRAFLNVFSEIREMLSCVQKKRNVNMENYPHFFSAFGRTQQYISFVKK